ncbi:MAG: hypothetical protein JO153_02980 [Solirubrobacterales bacterium]|nr:hypothetical protein [Solirubrobacterales bacterium]MBV9335802.1 hypothetical protein [Solirubrobacterales bacterium]MBV9915441.1 hypothetical protein [Solirubrobacterales bacterium]
MSAERTHSHSSFRRLLALALAAGLLALVGAGCGSSSSSSSAAAGGGTSSSETTASSASSSSIGLAKTKFVLHAGLAFGAFHRWIYKPIRAGDLRHPLSHKATLIKAGLAAGFVYHELGLALRDAQADPTLSKLVSPITELQTKFHDLGGGIKSGQVSEGDVTSLSDQISSVKQQSASAGHPITEQTPSTV